LCLTSKKFCPAEEVALAVVSAVVAVVSDVASMSSSSASPHEVRNSNIAENISMERNLSCFIV
jgi:hypothetical protein